MDGKTAKQRHEHALGYLQTVMNILFETAKMLNIGIGSKFEGKSKKNETVITVHIDATWATNMRSCICIDPAASRWTIKFHPDSGIVIDSSEFDDSGKLIEGSGATEFIAPQGTIEEGARALFQLLRKVERWEPC